MMIKELGFVKKMPFHEESLKGFPVRILEIYKETQQLASFHDLNS